MKLGWQLNVLGDNTIVGWTSYGCLMYLGLLKITLVDAYIHLYCYAHTYICHTICVQGYICSGGAH